MPARPAPSSTDPALPPRPAPARSPGELAVAWLTWFGLTRLVLGAVNWSAQWYRPGGRLSLDEIAAQTTRLLLK